MILIDATPLQSEHRLRGVGAYLRHLITAIEQEGMGQPCYLVSSVERHLVPGELPQTRIREILRPHRPAQVYWFYNEVALRLALRRLRPAVFFAPDFNGVVSNPYGRSVAVLHDLTALKLYKASLNPSQLLSDLRWWAYARKLQAVDQIVAVSESAKRDAVSLLNISDARIRVVHHGVDHEHYLPSTGKGKFSRTPPYFFHLGGLNPNKNQERIVEAFAQVASHHREISLYFAGPWREADLAWLEALRTRFQLGERVKHLGYVANEDLPSLYGNALAFLFPSLEEGFGMPILEAMACGAPVITSDRSSLPEVAGKAALLVDPYSVEALSSAMTLMLEMPAKRIHLQQLGLERAAQFTWNTTAQQTLQILLGAA